jgi:hypothetical protein
MKTIKFEDALKDYLEEMKRTGWYTKAYKAFVEANILKLVMERRPVAGPPIEAAYCAASDFFASCGCAPPLAGSSTPFL